MIPAYPDEILRRFVRRLRQRLRVSEAACFIAPGEYDIFAPSATDRAYIVSTTGASYNPDDDQWGRYLVETLYVNVTCFNRLHAFDESGRADSLVSRNGMNLLEMKRRVLNALINWDMRLPHEEDIEIASTVKASRSARPEFMKSNENGVYAGFLTVTFSVSYAIDICSDLPDE